MTPAAVATALREVFDPELGLDVISLGLIYGIEAGPGSVAVEMTMTSAACPMGDVLLDTARAVLEETFPGARVEVTATFAPPWDVAMADNGARRALGLAPR